jgi:protein O-mannosyl-transferase
MLGSAKISLVIFIYAALIFGTLLVYWQVRGFGFIGYDDNVYVYENPHVLNGLTRDGIVWAFTTGYASFWHPVTWLSLMLDRQLFDPDPGWFHLVSVFLHLANTLLLFAVLKKMTGVIWPSAFVAAAFALHPMHVESVAWIAERKDVLSTFFLLLTLSVYTDYVKRPSLFRYIAAIAIFAVGLMAKPILVTLPFLLLLLDYWPLNRFEVSRSVNIPGSQSRRSTPLHRIVIEKAPFFILSAVFSVITFLAQQKVGGVVDIKTIPLPDRVGNAFLSYAAYIGKMLWPQDLAVFYPFNAADRITLWQFALPTLLLAGISLLVLRFWRTRKYLVVGWLWFVGTLFPVIGLVRFTGSSHADRFTYVPYIGLFIMIAWGLSELLSKWPQHKFVFSASAAIALAAMGLCAHMQASYWKNDMTLFSHAIEVTKDNDIAYYNRGLAYYRLGRWQEAMEDFTESIRVRPDDVETYNNRGVAYVGLGRRQEAIEDFGHAIRIDPNYAKAHYNLGRVFGNLGRGAEAIEALKQAVRIQPDDAEACSNLAWLIATSFRIKNRDTNEATRLASHAVALSNYGNPAFLVTLAAAYASAGRFSEAVDTANKALSLADAANQPRLRDIIQHHLSFYTQGKPYIEPAPKLLPDPNKP